MFSPDGSRIAYTAFSPEFVWDTWVVPALGGKPQLWVANASGLVWIDPRRLLFSEKREGLHMALVTAAENRVGVHDVYVPPTDQGMAHRSYVSPDRKWVLLAEMDHQGWLPCRLIPFDGGSPGKPVGPSVGKCTNAAWSADGQWMYMNSDAGGSFHIYRQHFSDGKPEQITSGPTEEEGIALTPDGRSLITSVAISHSSVWISDRGVERQISSEGFGALPGKDQQAGSVFSPDGKRLFYLVRRVSARSFEYGELWAADLETGQTERMLADRARNRACIVASGIAFPNGTHACLLGPERSAEHGHRKLDVHDGRGGTDPSGGRAPKRSSQGERAVGKFTAPQEPGASVPLAS